MGRQSSRASCPSPSFLILLDLSRNRGTMRLEAAMPHLSPQTLTHAEQRAILRATARNLRDHLIYSLALGTGLRLAEIVGLDVGDVYTPDGRSKNRVRLRAEIAKNGRAGDVFLPDTLVCKLRRFWNWKRRHHEGLQPGDPLFCSQGGR